MTIVDARQLMVEGVTSRHDGTTHLWLRGQGMLCDRPDLKQKVPPAWITATESEVQGEQLCKDCYIVVADLPAEGSVGSAAAAGPG